MNMLKAIPTATFRDKKILTMAQLKKILSRSERTIRRYLQKWGIFVSYNKNSSYYTVPGIPKFNQYGIWNFKGVYFSRNGNLSKTLKYVIDNSPSGLTANEISEIIAIPAYTFLSHFKDKVDFTKEKYNGVYVYFSSCQETYKLQQQGRLNELRVYSESNLPTDADAIIILVELIKHPEVTIEELVRHIKRRVITISVDEVRNLFLYHGILKKTLEN